MFCAVILKYPRFKILILVTIEGISDGVIGSFRSLVSDFFTVGTGEKIMVKTINNIYW